MYVKKNGDRDYSCATLTCCLRLITADCANSVTKWKTFASLKIENQKFLLLFFFKTSDRIFKVACSIYRSIKHSLKKIESNWRNMRKIATFLNLKKNNLSLPKLQS